MKRMHVYLSNDFHNTETSILLPRKGSRFMTRVQVKRVKRKLCPSDECTCGDAFGERGQHYRAGYANPFSNSAIDYNINNNGDFEVWIND